MKNQELIAVILKNGYTAAGRGYTKVTEENTNWITLFKESSLQMYAYFGVGSDQYDDKSYDTNIINNITPELLQTLIDTLVF